MRHTTSSKQSQNIAQLRKKISAFQHTTIKPKVIFTRQISVLDQPTTSFHKKKTQPKNSYMHKLTETKDYILLLVLTERTVSWQLITTAITDGQQIF